MSDLQRKGRMAAQRLDRNDRLGVSGQIFIFGISIGVWLYESVFFLETQEVIRGRDVDPRESPIQGHRSEPPRQKKRGSHIRSPRIWGEPFGAPAEVLAELTSLRRRRMTCRKCGGLMYKEVIYTQQGSLLVFRCIHCGEIIDPLIVTNRR